MVEPRFKLYRMGITRQVPTRREPKEDTVVSIARSFDGQDPIIAADILTGSQSWSSLGGTRRYPELTSENYLIGAFDDGQVVEFNGLTGITENSFDADHVPVLKLPDGSIITVNKYYFGEKDVRKYDTSGNIVDEIDAFPRTGLDGTIQGTDTNKDKSKMVVCTFSGGAKLTTDPLSVEWEVNFGRGQISSIGIANEQVAIGFDGNYPTTKLQGFDADGNEKWSHTSHDWSIDTVVGYEGAFYSGEILNFRNNSTKLVKTTNDGVIEFANTANTGDIHAIAVDEDTLIVGIDDTDDAIYEHSKSSGVRKRAIHRLHQGRKTEDIEIIRTE